MTLPTPAIVYQRKGWPSTSRVVVVNAAEAVAECCVASRPTELGDQQLAVVRRGTRLAVDQVGELAVTCHPNSSLKSSKQSWQTQRYRSGVA